MGESLGCDEGGLTCPNEAEADTIHGFRMYFAPVVDGSGCQVAGGCA